MAKLEPLKSWPPIPPSKVNITMPPVKPVKPAPPEEAGWTMELLTDPAYLAVEGEQYWHRGQWKLATGMLVYAVPIYVRRPGKSFDPDKWCDRCELPEEDCCCAGAKGTCGPAFDLDPSHVEAASMAYMVTGVSLGKTREIHCDDEGNVVSDSAFPEDDKPLPWYKRWRQSRWFERLTFRP